MHRSSHRVARYRAALLLTLIALTTAAGRAGAQSGEAIALVPGTGLDAGIRTGEPLQISIRDRGPLGMTIEAVVDRTAVDAIAGPEPRSYAALLAVPPGPLEPVEVLEVRYLPHGSSTPVTRPWDELKPIAAKSPLVSLDDLGWLRSQRIARLVVNPWLIEPDAETAAKLLSITVVVRFSQPHLASENGAPAESASFEQVLAVALAGSAPASYRDTPPIPPPAAGPIVPHPGVAHVVLQVAAPGLTAVTGADLRLAGVDLTAIEPDRLRLYHQGRELPIRVSGATDHVDEHTRVVFFAPGVSPEQQLHSRWDVLALTWASQPGARMPTRPAWLGGDGRDAGFFTVLRHVEQDLVADSGGWYWCRLSAEKGAPDSRFVVIPNAQSLVPGEPMEIRVALRGLTAVAESPVDHHVRVIFNNRWVRDLTWDGRIPYLMIDELPSDLLYVGDNVVEIQLPGDLDVFADQVLLDWLELRYPTWGEDRQTFDFTTEPPATGGRLTYQVYNQRGPSVSVFDLTDPLRPIVLSDPVVQREGLDSVLFQHDWDDDAPRRFAVAVDERMQRPAAVSYRPGGHDLLSEPAGADLLIVAHPAVIDGLSQLIERRRAQGLRVALVSTEEVYDAFGYGFPSPDAIRDFLRHAFASWAPPAPSFLLLAGDATSDPLDRLGYGADDLVPTFNRTRGAYPSDSWFALVTAGDDLPDLHVGRLAVRSAAEAAVVVAKILAYERGSDDDSWRRRALLVSDDDPAGRFVAEAEAAADALRPFGFSAGQLSIAALDLPPELPESERIRRTREALSPALEDAINQGAGLVQYFGHGGYRVWAHEQLLDVRPGEGQVERLTNIGRLPVVLSFSCLTTAFDNPRFDTIAERLVNSERGGAVAFFGSSGNTTNPRSWTFGAELAAITTRGSDSRLGTALTIAKLERVRSYGSGGATPLDSNLLIGDPSLVLDFDLTGR